MHSITREKLRDSTYAAAYLQECSHRGPGNLYAALREVVQARDGGFAWLSRQTGLGRASLYKALSEDGNPSYSTIQRVLGVLGLDIAVAPTDTRFTKMKTSDFETNGLIMDRGSAEYITFPQENGAGEKSRILPGGAKGQKYYLAEDSNAPFTASDDAEQERLRELTLELYTECDAVDRQPGTFTDPVKAGVATMILEKHRRKGMQL
jgi:probable addiction module antidote protein